MAELNPLRNLNICRRTQQVLELVLQFTGPDDIVYFLPWLCLIWINVVENEVHPVSVSSPGTRRIGSYVSRTSCKVGGMNTRLTIR